MSPSLPVADMRQRAFPSSAADDRYGGMELRDWFASVAPEPPALWWGNGAADCAGYALWAYQYADAMMAARNG